MAARSGIPVRVGVSLARRRPWCRNRLMATRGIWAPPGWTATSPCTSRTATADGDGRGGPGHTAVGGATGGRVSQRPCRLDRRGFVDGGAVGSPGSVHRIGTAVRAIPFGPRSAPAA